MMLRGDSAEVEAFAVAGRGVECGSGEEGFAAADEGEFGGGVLSRGELES